jgi:hypothetical protein
MGRKGENVGPAKDQAAQDYIKKINDKTVDARVKLGIIGAGTVYGGTKLYDKIKSPDYQTYSN